MHLPAHWLQAEYVLDPIEQRLGSALIGFSTTLVVLALHGFSHGAGLTGEMVKNQLQAAEPGQPPVKQVAPPQVRVLRHLGFAAAVLPAADASAEAHQEPLRARGLNQVLGLKILRPGQNLSSQPGNLSETQPTAHQQGCGAENCG